MTAHLYIVQNTYFTYFIIRKAFQALSLELLLDFYYPTHEKLFPENNNTNENHIVKPLFDSESKN